MESNGPSPSEVNWFDALNRENLSSIDGLPSDIDEQEKTKPRRLYASEINDRRTWELFNGFRNYLHGVWRQSALKIEFYDWSAQTFARTGKKRGLRDVSIKTLERQFPRFQHFTDEFRFQRVYVGRRPTVRVTLADGVQLAVPGATIRERLLAAIRSYVRKSGRKAIDREFCRKFAALSLLPLSAVQTIWTRLEPRELGEGFSGRWRNKAEKNRKLHVECAERWKEICAERAAAVNSKNLPSTDPQTSPPVSFYSVKERFKTSAPAAHAMESARFAQNDGDGEGDAPAKPDSPLPPNRSETTRRTGPDAREPSMREPLQICGRWVSAKKLRKFAGWLAVARLKFAHVSRDRVAWLFPHSRNFAYRALRRGYRSEAIEAAYAFGVEWSYQNALDKDRLPGGGYASVRQPSEAVCYAWRKLRADDPRDDAARWAEFFAGPRVRLTAKVAKVARKDAKRAKEKSDFAISAPLREKNKFTSANAEKRAASSSEVSRGATERTEKNQSASSVFSVPPCEPKKKSRVRELREVIGRLEGQQAAANAALPLTARELIAWLALRELTLATFQQLPWSQRKKMLARAEAWAREKRDEK